MNFPPLVSLLEEEDPNFLPDLQLKNLLLQAHVEGWNEKQEESVLRALYQIMYNENPNDIVGLSLYLKDQISYFELSNQFLDPKKREEKKENLEDLGLNPIINGPIITIKVGYKKK